MSPSWLCARPRENGSYVKLSKAQRKLLGDLAGYPYGEGRVNPVAERTARVLKRHGLIEWAGTGGWVKVTDKGRDALRTQTANTET